MEIKEESRIYLTVQVIFALIWRYSITIILKQTTRHPHDCGLSFHFQHSPGSNIKNQYYHIK